MIAGATVFATRGPDRLLQQAVTDDSGRYSITFAEGTGDYLVAVQASGFKPARRRVTRVGTEREYTVDFILSSNVTTLDAVNGTPACRRGCPQCGAHSQETGSSEAGGRA